MARVEDTLSRLARAYGITDAEIFATPTGIFVTLGADGYLTAIRRVQMRALALDRVSAVNALSRELAAAPREPEEVLQRLEAIAQQPAPVPRWAEPLVSAVGAASCTMLVGGALSDLGPALLANVVVQGVLRGLARFRFPDAIGDFMAGFTAVFCALAATAWLGAHFTPVIAGGIMVLVPGIAFTSSVRDAMAGDLTSAGARGLEALMKAAALASGVASALWATGRL